MLPGRKVAGCGLCSSSPKLFVKLILRSGNSRNPRNWRFCSSNGRFSWIKYKSFPSVCLVENSTTAPSVQNKSALQEKQPVCTVLYCMYRYNYGFGHQRGGIMRLFTFSTALFTGESETFWKEKWDFGLIWPRLVLYEMASVINTQVLHLHTVLWDLLFPFSDIAYFNSTAF